MPICKVMNAHDYITKMQDLVNHMRSLGEDVSERRLIEKILRSVLPKFQMVTTNIMVSKYLNTIQIDELSGFLLNVEDNQPYEQVEHAFSIKHRGRGRSRGQYHNQNQNINQQSSQGDASPPRGRGRNPSQFRGRRQGRDGGRNGGRGGGLQCYYFQIFGHLERDCYAKI